MGLMPESTLKLSVSSESMPVPEGQPATVRRPRTSAPALTSKGLSGTPTTMQLAAWAESGDRGGEGRGVGDRGEDDRSAPEFLEFFGWILRGGVDVDLRAELFGEWALVGSASDGDGAVAALGGVLHAEMAEATDAEDGDSVAGASAAVAKCVVGRDAGAEKRRGVNIGEVAWNEGEGVGRSDDVVCIAAVEADAGDKLIFAEGEIAAAAGMAVIAVAAMPAEADALPHLEERDIRADGIDEAGDFMAGDARNWMPGQPPNFVAASLWQTPQACTRMRTCPGPGSGNSLVTS